MSQQSHIQIHLQTYTIVAPANDNLNANYELYRSTRSFAMTLFVLHCTLYITSRIHHRNTKKRDFINI